jgi:hypothetical protein
VAGANEDGGAAPCLAGTLNVLEAVTDHARFRQV